MRRRVDLGITLLVGANLVLVAALAAILGLGIDGASPGHPEQASPTPELAASASPETIPMGLAHIPTNDACVLCHEGGGSGSVKTIPALGHPLEGWRQCLACHANADLTRTAPGHDGIEQGECLNCHKEPRAGVAITMPHLALQDQHCLDCHGTFAHLPTSMASRKETSCTLCHRPTELPPPQFPHQLSEERSCRQCHRSAEVGNLPIDHALRDDGTCLLCHDLKTAEEGPAGSAGTTGTEGTELEVAGPASSLAP